MKADKKLLLLAVQVRSTFNSEHFREIIENSKTTYLLDCMSDITTMSGRKVVTLLLRFYNRGAHCAVQSGINRTVTINLIDSESNMTVSSMNLDIKIPKTKDEYDKMVDLRLPEGDNIGNHSYIIKVKSNKTEHVYFEKRLRLFSLPTIRKIPLKWYSVTGGSLGREDPVGSDDFVAVNPDMAEMLTAKIRVHLNHEMLKDNLPELCLRTVTTGGCEHVKYAVPTPDPDGGEGDYIVMQSFMMADEESGITYTEVSCMTYVIGVVPFRTGNVNIEGVLTQDYIINIKNPTMKDFEKAIYDFINDNCPEQIDELGEKEPDSMDKLNALVGLDRVKEQVVRYTDIVKFNKKRMNVGLPEAPLPKHSMFLGSPGTGKTTVAKIMGEILYQAGILSSGHLVVCERSTLVGQNYGSESENTRAALEKAQGGILFIDEAYQLYQPQDPRDPGKFVIETLLTALADESNRDWMLILAGYTEPMTKMLKMNPGFSSRIPLSNIINFDDYGEEDLMEIARRYFLTYKYNLTVEAMEKLKRNISTAVARRNESFGNARYVMNLIQTDIIPAMAVRLGKEKNPTTTQLSTIIDEDIPLPNVKLDAPRMTIGFR